MEGPQVGDHWTYEVRDDITGDIKFTTIHTITDASASEISVRQSVQGKPGFGYQTYSQSWDIIDSGSWRSKPNDGSGVRLPLAVGKTWPIKSTDVNTTSGVSGQRSGSSKVIAQESVTTQAGTFDTFKIESDYRFQNSNDPTKGIQVLADSWYAPSVDHWVKRTVVQRSKGRVLERSTAELVEYGRRQ
jgi:hypothetical protein